MASTVSVAPVRIVGVVWHAASKHVIPSASSVVDPVLVQPFDFIGQRPLDVSPLGLPREVRGKLEQDFQDQEGGHSTRRAFQT